ncbi:MAG: septal ring lytic transglycosylase RlpA family protein [Verrucomicrobiales bacterium]
MRFAAAGGIACCLMGCGGGYVGYKHAPYSIRGQRYYPIEPRHAVGYRETGIASWYDERRWFGIVRGETALGERFKPSAMAGAHKTLPLPCVVKVWNLENGKTATIRLNDRGPFVGDRILDVTPKVAKRLGFKEKGLAQVGIEVISVGDGRYRIR